MTFNMVWVILNALRRCRLTPQNSWRLVCGMAAVESVEWAAGEVDVLSCAP